MAEQKQKFSFNPPINLSEEGKWLLEVSSFEATNSVFNITEENNWLLITIPDHWETKSGEKTIDEQNIFSELRSLELHAKEVRKRGSKIKLGDNEYKLSDFDFKKNEIPEEFRNSKYNDKEDIITECN